MALDEIKILINMRIYEFVILPNHVLVTDSPEVHDLTPLCASCTPFLGLEPYF